MRLDIYGVQFPPKFKLRIKHCTFDIYAYFTIEHSSLYFVELTLQFNIVLLSFIFVVLTIQHCTFIIEHRMLYIEGVQFPPKFMLRICTFII